ncbi:MAG TPA: GPW/gp25 family protein [Gammaproteobacteria bacterium]
MNAAAKLRTVRFDLPFDAGGGEASASAGFQLSASGGLALLEGSAAIRQAIMILLSTRPGERLMRPDYGCPLHRLAFEPNDAATAGLAIHYIRSALTRWEPRIDILSLVTEPGADIDAESGRLAVRLEYRVRATSEIASMQLDLDLQGRDLDAVSDA